MERRRLWRMSYLNRGKILWSYLSGGGYVHGLSVEYIVEATAKCNLDCPMRMKHERDAKVQVVVQMVRMPGNAHEAEEFHRFGAPFRASTK